MFERRRAKKRIAAEEVLTAATPDGELAHVNGVVRALERTMHAPTTGRVCVAFACRVYEPSRAEPGSFEPNKPFDCVELVPFAIECELGRVIVDSQFAELVVPEHRASLMHDVHWTDFCDARVLSPASVGVESPVMVGDIVTVLGTTMRRTAVPGREADFRESPTQLCLVGDFDHPLLILSDRS